MMYVNDRAVNSVDISGRGVKVWGSVKSLIYFAPVFSCMYCYVLIKSKRV